MLTHLKPVSSPTELNRAPLNSWSRIVLRSLRRNAAYAGLQDEGKALEAAMTDGVSRYGPNNNRGYGFRPIFTGLANLHGELRFRSGDHAITMDGTSPALTTSRISQKAPLDGFFASVRCHAMQR